MSPVFTEEQLEQLREACAGVAALNWDGGCTIEQDAFGTLIISLWGEDKEVEAVCHAICKGSFEGTAIWHLRLVEDEIGVLTTLCPALIMGYMSL